MQYRIENTTRKVNPKNARERMGHVIGIADRIVPPLRAATITEEAFKAHESWYIARQAAGDIRITPQGTGADSAKKDLEEQVQQERELALQRAATEPSAVPVSAPAPVLEDPNNDAEYDGVPSPAEASVTPDIYRSEPVHGAKRHSSRKTTTEA